MTALAAVLAGSAAAAAVANWLAVGRGWKTGEYVAKPLTMLLLVGFAATVEPAVASRQTWFVAACVFCLAGDVFLMLPRDRFVPGLASFLLGHLAYIVGLRHLGTSVGGLVAGMAIVVLALPLLAPRVLAAIRRSDDPGLAVPVSLYIVVISAMVVAAGASGVVVALVAAVSFYASDALIAWTRFVADLPHGRLLVMTTYHLAQIGFVVALL